MKIVIFYFLVPVLAFVHKCTGQVESSSENNLHFRLTPLSLIDVYNGSSYKFGFEKKIFRATAVYTDVGGYFKKFSGLLNCTGFNLDAGIKYYLVDKDINQGTYLTLNYFYKEQGFDRKDSILTETPYEIKYHTDKYVTCLNINAGYLEIFNDRLVLDVYGGFGLRLKNVNSSMTAAEFENAKYYRDSQSEYFTVRPGKFVVFNFNVRFKIGFRIN